MNERKLKLWIKIKSCLIGLIGEEEGIFFVREEEEEGRLKSEKILDADGSL